jgi:hypothetical protein
LENQQQQLSIETVERALGRMALEKAALIEQLERAVAEIQRLRSATSQKEEGE